MRLTLRTLLAYLDDILEPADAEELACKIRESDFASGLVHRIRGATGRMRLSSPPVIGKGMGNDANTVAEYLDNTLPTDRIPDFERVCLESDMHLAETASCHEVLTLVLGEPAHIEDSLRERVHRMGNRSAPAKQARHRFDAGESTSDETEAVSRETPAWRDDSPAEVPDYVAVGRRSSVIPWLVAGLMGFFATITILMAMGVLPGNSPTQEVASRPAEPPLQPAPPLDGPPPRTTAPDAAHDSAAPARDASWNEDPTDIPPPAPGESPSEPRSELPSADVVEALPADPGASLPRDLDPNLESADAGMDPGMIETNGPPRSGNDLERNDLERNDLERNDLERNEDGAMEHEPAPANLVDSATTADADSINADAGVVIPAADQAVAPVLPDDRDLGKLISDEQVLAVWDEVDQSWFRVATRSPLEVGQRYRVPTIFRPQLMLSKGIQMTLNGRCQFVFLPPATAGAIGIRFDFGRAVLTNFSGNVEQIEWRFGDQQIMVTFGDGQSEFAIESSASRLPGSDPNVPSDRHDTRIWATSGTIGIQDGDQPVRSIAAGQLWSSTPNQSTAVTEAAVMPPWIEAARRRPVDRDALDRLEPELVVDRPLTLILSEKAGQTTGRFARGQGASVSSLAARCLASLDHFEPLLSSLGDDRHKSAWGEHFSEVLAALTRGPETSGQLRQAMEHVWGRNSEQLFRFAAGFTPEQLDNGAAAELVESLSSEDLATRVVAFETLRRLTGASHLYFAHQTPARRQTAVTAWQRQLRSGKIAYKHWPPPSGP